MVSQRANTTIIIVIIGIDNHHNASSLRAPLPPCPPILDSTTTTPVWCHYSVVFVATNCCHCCRCRRTPNGNAAVNSEWMAWEGSRSPIYYVYEVGRNKVSILSAWLRGSAYDVIATTMKVLIGNAPPCLYLFLYNLSSSIHTRTGMSW